MEVDSTCAREAKEADGADRDSELRGDVGICRLAAWGRSGEKELVGGDDIDRKEGDEGAEMVGTGDSEDAPLIE